MKEITKIIDYLISIGFTKQPVRIPFNTKETIKRNFYIVVKDKSNLIFVSSCKNSWKDFTCISSKLGYS